LVNLTTHPGVKFEMEAAKLVFTEPTITGSRYATKKDFQDATEWVRSGKVKPIVTEVRPLERVEEIHSLLAEGKVTS